MSSLVSVRICSGEWSQLGGGCGGEIEGMEVVDGKEKERDLDWEPRGLPENQSAADQMAPAGCVTRLNERKLAVLIDDRRLIAASPATNAPPQRARLVRRTLPSPRAVRRRTLMVATSIAEKFATLLMRLTTGVIKTAVFVILSAPRSWCHGAARHAH